MDRSSGIDAISRLIAPCSLAEFSERYWQRDVLVLHRENQSYYDEIITINDIDDLISSLSIPTSHIDVGKDAVGAAKDSYSRGSYIRPSDVLRLHRQGQTIILRALHLWNLPVRRLCDSAEAFFHNTSQANLYMTPQDTRSSYPHWDAHDIFVLQVAGSKRWVLYESPLQRPLYTYEFDAERHEVGPEIGEFTLHAGDIAYVPRGVIHNPIATGYSVHIALGVLVKTWADVFAAMYEDITKGNPNIRASLPIKFGNHEYDMEKCMSEFSGLAAAFTDPSTMHSAVNKISARVEANRWVDTKGMFIDFATPQTITRDSIVELPAFASAALSIKEDKCYVTLNGVDLVVPSVLASALDFIKKVRRFSVHEIPDMSLADKISLVTRLVEEGCLRLYRDDHSPSN
ncbi:hypothetical protein LMG31506_04853 [Cupriavidus yeoncheonensis]|uniref:JmjC domain-containing protein n=1 Tax=Cupriavidus yeoncheonensis TaxID=1462994 RepID=A0A916IZD8_9BURK|nr:cupin domain-containing protein [Cupriavidus yeoncheonensis]CAG2153576.1 hypothetical protein LMG31506_04853 [Cupriavidus yeoncheonensis]